MSCASHRCCQPQAVRIIGWGTDTAAGQDYWTIAPALGPDFGEGGFMRIKRGENQGRIEESVTGFYACWSSWRHAPLLAVMRVSSLCVAVHRIRALVLGSGVALLSHTLAEPYQEDVSRHKGTTNAQRAMNARWIVWFIGLFPAGPGCMMGKSSSGPYITCQDWIAQGSPQEYAQYRRCASTTPQFPIWPPPTG